MYNFIHIALPQITWNMETVEATVSHWEICIFWKLQVMTPEYREPQKQECYDWYLAITLQLWFLQHKMQLLSPKMSPLIISLF